MMPYEFEQPRKNLRTSEFMQMLSHPDIAKSGLLTVIDVDFEDLAFLSGLAATPYHAVESTDEGAISVVKEAEGFLELDFSRQAGFFGLHTDGMYYPSVPEIGILYCVDPGVNTFPTVFVDTRILVDQFKQEGKLETLKRINFIYRRKTAVDYPRPLIEQHPVSGELVLNIGLTPECRLEPQPDSDISQQTADEFYTQMIDLAENNLTRVHTWRSNQLVIFDNATFVHGRGLPNQRGTQKDSKRELKRIWLSQFS